MKFSGANLLMGFRELFVRTKVNFIALLTVNVMLCRSFLYFSESNKIRPTELELEISDSTPDAQPIESLVITLAYNYAGDFEYIDNDIISENIKPNSMGYALQLDFYFDFSITREQAEEFSSHINIDPKYLAQIDVPQNSIYKTICSEISYTKPQPPYMFSIGQGTKNKIDKRYNEITIAEVSHKGNKLENKYSLFFFYPDTDQDSISYSSKMSLANGGKNSSLYIGDANISSLRIKKFNLPQAKHVEFNILYNTPVGIDVITVEPDIRSPSRLTFNSPETIEQISTAGFYVFGHSLSNGRAVEMHNFIIATLIGFLLSLCVELIYRIAAQYHKASENNRPKNIS